MTNKDLVHFSQNEGCGGFQEGGYNSKAIQPTHVNWTRQSKLMGPENPSVKWEMDLNGNGFYSSPIIGKEGIIYFGTGNGFLYLIQPDGSIRSTKKLGGNLQTPVLGFDETLYIGTRDNNKLYALNINGEVIWEFETRNMFEYSPSIALDGTIYISSQDRTLYAINPDGTKKWEFKRKFVFWSSPSIGVDGTIYIGSNENAELLAINPDGSLKWAANIGYSYNSSPIIGSDGTIYIESYSKDQKNLYALNHNDGSVKWCFSLQRGNITTSPALGHDGTLYVGTDIFKLLALNLDGTKKWDCDIEGFTYYQPLIDCDGNVYIGTTIDENNKMVSRVFRFNSDGMKKWVRKIDGSMTSIALGTDRVLYFASSEDSKIKLYALGES
jgi:outer membrane protein assembly factor BamB